MRVIHGSTATLAAITISRGEPNFPHNPVVVSVLYIGERPEMISHNEKSRKAKTRKGN
jgi:hypothetical protein